MIVIDKSVTVLLVEDDPEECKAFVEYIDTLVDVCLVGVTNNASKALEDVKDNMPDAIILDIELHGGSGNGISFLSSLKTDISLVRPYVIVTTHNVSRQTHEIVRTLGADFVMVKSQEDYSAQHVVDLVKSICKTINKNKKTTPKESAAAKLSPNEIKRRLENRVAAEVDQIGISPKMIGREYLIEAILQLFEGKDNYLKSIALKHKKTDASIQRAMQNAINKAWNNTNPDDLERLYTACIQSQKGVPTITEFICYYRNKLKTEY